MKVYSVFRAVFLNKIEDLDIDNLGQSFSMDLSGAERYAEDRSVRDRDRQVFIIKAYVTEPQINWEQTVAQALSGEYNEDEIVLWTNEDVKFEVKDIYGNLELEGEGSTGYDRMDGDETLACPFNENHDEWSVEVYEKEKAEILSCLD
ncbi:MAG: hypothetical protein LAT81_14240 [Oceanicaulis sp.]|nr:hypothetical protein [Oceanicaulis sp.]